MPRDMTYERKVLVPIAMGTEEMEAVILAGVLRRAGADVTLASVEDGLEVEASYGTRIIADKSIAACANQEFDLVALPSSKEGVLQLLGKDLRTNRSKPAGPEMSGKDTCKQQVLDGFILLTTKLATGGVG
ncbi:hypothetical protein TRIUR3_15789 [Triticum urartu]|uniref:DJ-1/PfpI domain-containing protein n=1 Tax=Triticum urartu TaxID=4572 RepID=M7Z2X4_TRIUA|nr:hypothetical protein TRIUR3_15789 [Triticum urartu]